MKGKQVVNFLAYLAIVLIGATLLLNFILGKLGVSAQVVDATALVAQCLAYVITAIFAFLYAKSKKNFGFMIAYVVAVVLIIIMIVV